MMNVLNCASQATMMAVKPCPRAVLVEIAPERVAELEAAARAVDAEGLHVKVIPASEAPADRAADTLGERQRDRMRRHCHRLRRRLPSCESRRS